MAHRNHASVIVIPALAVFAAVLSATPVGAQVNIRLLVPYHSQIPPGDPNVPANWPWTEPGNAALPNGYCTCACLDMLFNYATTNGCPHSNPPLPQQEFAAVANTNDCIGGGTYCGTYLTDARRAVHFSPGSFAWPCNPPNYVNPNATGYSWPLVFQSPGPTTKFGMIGIEGTWNWTRQQFKQVLQAGWPIMVNVSASAVGDSLPQRDPEDSDAERTDYDEVENTVVGHSIVVRGCSDVLGTFLIHDPTLGPALMINQNTFWNTWWTSKEFLVVLPWSTTMNVPALGSALCVPFTVTATATYTDPLPVAGTGAAVQTSGKLSFFPSPGQAQNSALAQGQNATIPFAQLTGSGQSQVSTWNCVTQAAASATHVVAETWGRVTPTAHSSPTGYTDDIGSMTRAIVSVGPPELGDVSICYIPRVDWWSGPHIRIQPHVFLPGFPNQVEVELENRGVQPVTNVILATYYGDPTLTEKVPGNLRSLSMGTVPFIAPGEKVWVPAATFAAPPGNSFGQPYYTFGALAYCVMDPPNGHEWVEFDNNIACKGEHRAEMAPYSGTYLDFWVANPGEEEQAYVVVRMETYLPPGWNATLAPAGMDSVLMDPEEVQQRTLFVDATEGIGMVDVFEDTYDVDGRFLRRTGGLSFLVWTAGTEVPEKETIARVALASPSPNPTSGNAELSFMLPEACRATVSVYDLSGRVVARPFDAVAPAGTTRVPWDCRDSAGQPLASGVYFVKLTAAGMADARKLVVIH